MDIFTDLLVEPCVHSLIQVDNKKRALQFLSQLFANYLKNINSQSILEHLINREKLGSTQIGNGIALPHARLEALKSPLLALVTLKTPIIYDEGNTNKVDILCALLVPEKTADQYLNILKELAFLLQKPAFCYALRHAKTNIDLYNTIIHRKT